MRANAYILGSGPSTLTVLFFRWFYWDDDYAPFTPYVYEGQTEQQLIEEDMQRIEGFISDLFSGREHVVFLGPAIDLSSEAWQFWGAWDVQRREDGTVIAVHPDRDLWRRMKPNEYQSHLSNLEMELSAFTQAVTTANQARVTEYGGRIGEDTSLPMLVTDANQLRQYYTEVGAYAPGSPTPVPPPPPCGLAVDDQANNPGLMRDCIALLSAKDTLAGTAALGWSATSTISTWEGIGLNASSTRVTALDLDDEDLDGTIPPALGDLSALETLDLSDNDLTGEIPEELGRLLNLQTLRLSGNSFTGCIPVALKDVPTNDLASLNLLYCRPPTPQNLRAGTTTETSVALSWDAVPNVIRYRVEYLGATATEWTVDDDMISGTTHTVDELTCGGDFRFRVSAYDSGTTYAAEWSRPSDTATATTGECRGPEFSLSSYDFSVSEDTSIGQSVGRVSATDPDDGDPDGLALSSRNAYLTPGQRESALSLYESLKLAEKLYSDGFHDARAIRREMLKVLEDIPGASIDYVSIANADTLAELDSIDPAHPALVSLAVRIGAIRLIDNLTLETGVRRNTES